MKLAVNYSPQAAELLDEGQVQFDLYKCPDWEDLIRQVQQDYPVYVHFSLHAGRKTMKTADWDKIGCLLSNTGTEYVNVHLAPDGALYPDLQLDTIDPLWQTYLIDSVLDDVRLAVERFGAKHVILENVPWDVEYNIPRPLILPECITYIVEETGCGLLLDIAHARIAALYLQIDDKKYLDMLPIKQLKEVHITGTLYNKTTSVWHDHFRMTSHDWMLTDYLFARIKAGQCALPEIVTLEYGGVGPMFEWRSKKCVLAEELPRLGDLVAGVRQKLLL